MAREPRVRALTSQVALQHIDTLSEPLRETVLRAAGDVGVARSAFQFSWIPFGVQIRILDAMRRAMSQAQWVESQRALMLGYLDKPVLRGLLDTSIRMFGMSVSTLAKWTPRAYDALFKDAGALTFEPSTTSGELGLVLDDFPHELFVSGTFVEALQSSLEVIFVLVKAQGTVTVSEVDRVRGHARYTLRWRDPASP